MYSFRKLLILTIIVASIFFFNFHNVFAQTVSITLNPQIKYQTITGWEGVAQSGEDYPEYPKYQSELTNRLVTELGVNRVRIEARSGMENSVDYFTLVATGQMTQTDANLHRYEIINDNADPNVINPAGFKFAFLDRQIDKVVLPLKQKLVAQGEKLFINLNVVDFRKEQGASTVQFESNPNEYAEFILAMYQHLQTKYGWTPDTLELLLEPENTAWTGTNMGNAVVATVAMFQKNGLTPPKFVAPSTTAMSNAVNYLNQMLSVTGVQPHIAELSYHRYGGVSLNALQVIKDRALQLNIQTSMLEHIGSGYVDLHQDLKIGRVSAWQEYTYAFPGTTDDGASYYRIDLTDSNNPKVIINSNSRWLQQYFKYIRFGAQRISATLSGCPDDQECSPVDPLAFINKDGKYVIVVKTASAQAISINGLPAGTYGITYTRGGGDTQWNLALADQTITNGSLSTSMPAAGVITIFGKTGGAVSPTIPLSPTLVPSPTLSPILSPTSTQVCPMKSKGDADCAKNPVTQQDITISDFEIWRKEFFGQCNERELTKCGTNDDNIGSVMDADFDNLPEKMYNNAKGVTMIDFEIWRKGFFSQ